MTPVSVIRLNAQAAILERHPELNGLVTFDASQPSVWPGMALIELRITCLDHEMTRKLSAAYSPHPYGTPRQTPLGLILDHYCSGEDGFNLNGYRWCIGDGDDSLALAEIDMTTVTLWVRTWWDAAS